MISTQMERIRLKIEKYFCCYLLIYNILDVKNYVINTHPNVFKDID